MLGLTRKKLLHTPVQYCVCVIELIGRLAMQWLQLHEQIFIKMEVKAEESSPLQKNVRPYREHQPLARVCFNCAMVAFCSAFCLLLSKDSLHIGSIASVGVYCMQL